MRPAAVNRRAVAAEVDAVGVEEAAAAMDRPSSTDATRLCY
jgi:hypothetical protein